MDENTGATKTTDAAEAAKALRVVVFADFVCPYSFLAVEQIDRIDGVQLATALRLAAGGTMD